MLRATFWTIGAPAAVLGLVALLAGKGPGHERLNVAYASAATLKGSLLSPRNLAFDRVRVTDAGATCMEYRLGATAEGRARAVVLGSDVARSDAHDGRFALQWNRQCLGLAHDVTSAVDRFF
jgi:hypothetical protein